MKKHSMFWMVLGCVLPLLLILLLPALGIKKDYTLFLFVVLMFACHLFMMRGHGGEENKGNNGGEKHEHH